MIPRQTVACSYGVGGRVGVARHDRRGAGDPDVVADADGARVADALLEGRARRDELPVHAASLAVRGGAAPDRRMAVRPRGGRGHRRDRGNARRALASVPVGVRDEARDCGRGARRGRGGDRRPRRGRRAAGIDGPAPARPCLRAPVRGRARRSHGRASGGSTRTTASRWRPRSSRSAPRCRSRSTSPRPGRRPASARRLAGLGRRGDARRPAGARARAARAATDRAGDARGGDGGAVPRARRRAAGLRPAGAERLGPRLRAPRRQVAALDGHAQLAAHVRPLRPQRHVPLGRSGRRARARLPHRPRRSATGRPTRGRASPTPSWRVLVSDTRPELEVAPWGEPVSDTLSYRVRDGR